MKKFSNKQKITNKQLSIEHIFYIITVMSNVYTYAVGGIASALTLILRLGRRDII